MKVGDLVKVYDFTHVARERLGAKVQRLRVQPRGLEIDAHYVGLIVATSDNDPKHRRVLRCVDGEWEDYNVNRLEVIA
jgi:hypothetical protein